MRISLQASKTAFIKTDKNLTKSTTLFFRRDLSEISLADLESMSFPASFWGLTACLKSKQFPQFVEQYATRLKAESQPSNEDQESRRLSAMQGVNPRYVLRNWIAQRAIEAAEADDFTEVEFLLHLLENPFRQSRQSESKSLRIRYSSQHPNLCKWV